MPEWLNSLWLRLWALLRRRQLERDLQDEVAFHLTMRESQLRASDADDAPAGARRRFGSPTRIREDLRDTWAVAPAMTSLTRDFQYATRTLKRRPGFSATVVLTLALGIGGTASTYGVVRTVLLDPLPYSHEREVGVFWKKTDWTHEEYLYIRGRVPGFRQVALYRQRDTILRDGEGPSRLVRAVAASSELFEVLGAGPILGRGFRAGDDVPNAEPVAILSFGLWQDLGGNLPIGARLTLDGAQRTVIGVMPRGFWFPDPSVRIWIPEPLTPESRSFNSTLVGRVAPTHNVRAMETPLAQLVAMLDERFDFPAPQWDKTKNPYVLPLRDDVLGPMRPALLATLGAMTLVLLIGCANVAALVLGQVDARSIEFAVRSALGAKRQRLTQLLIVEVLLVAIVAGALGAVLAWVGFPVVIGALPLGAWADSAAPDWRAFTSAMAIAIAAALLVMLVPTISLYRGDLRGVMNSARTGGIEGRWWTPGERSCDCPGRDRGHDRRRCGSARAQRYQPVRGRTRRAH